MRCNVILLICNIIHLKHYMMRLSRITIGIFIILIGFASCKEFEPYDEWNVYIDQVNWDSSGASITLYNSTDRQISIGNWVISSDGYEDYYTIDKDKEMSGNSWQGWSDGAFPFPIRPDSQTFRLFDNRGRQVDVWKW